MQSRYYNADWGRFINADGIAAVTGELLSSNMFVYSKNNPTTLKDPSGFRSVLTEGEETDEMRSASYKVMNAARNRYSTTTSSSVKNNIKGTSGVSYDYVGAKSAAALNAVQNIPIKVKVPYYNFTTKATIAELGIYSNAFLGIGIISLFYSLHSNNEIYKPAEATAMNMIDVLAWTGGMFAGAALVTAGFGLIPIVGAGLLIGTLGYGSKLGVHYIFKKFD